MHKIYSRPRIYVPNIKKRKNKKIITIIIILTIAFATVKMVLDAVLPIFNTLCEHQAKSVATVISNEQATKVMKDHSYDELFTIEKDQEGNITMVKSNVISINEIISDVAIKIQEEINKKGRDDIEIASRKLYRI